jgi:hypothetical protein
LENFFFLNQKWTHITRHASRWDTQSIYLIPSCHNNSFIVFFFYDTFLTNLDQLHLWHSLLVSLLYE